MIEHLTGELEHLSEEALVLSANGVGYRISISRATYADLQERAGPCKVYTHLHLREDEIALYGFSTVQERQLFQLLITVSGVGPRVAMSILSRITPKRFQEALLRERRDALLEIKGIGRKTAERLIVELKEKIAKIPLGAEPRAMSNERETIAFRALTRTLGFTEHEARRALAQVKADSTEDLIKKALEILSGRSPP